jgi:penicillin G amidase
VTALVRQFRKRKFLKAFIAFLLLIASVAGAVRLFAWWSLPQLNGKLVLPGLKSEVRVIRDNWGIPHIFAGDELDSFRALGFVAAQDRLFQMDIQRRLANGQLSEIVGNAALPSDKLARTLGFRHYAEKLLASNSIQPETLRAAEAFRDGVNSFIATQTLPIEFKILGYRPRPFEIVEMLAFAGYMSYGFSEAFRGDLLYSDLIRDIPGDKVDELRGGVEGAAPTIANASSIRIDPSLFLALHDNAIAQSFGAFDGSNSWVAGPSRSKSGYALLANDPHIGFSKPSIWYEAHIVSPAMEVYGHFISFIPFPILGHTRDIAWAITMSEVDDMDFYREKVNPQDPHQVSFRGHWVPLEVREERITVKGNPDVVLPIQTGPHGPLIQHLLAQKPDELIAVKWQYHEPDNRVLETFFRLTHAKTIANYTDALRIAKSPGLNLSYADKSGNIAWWVLGQIPDRPSTSRPDMVMDGSSGIDEYLGYIPFDSNPHLVNPAEGLIITANNKPAANTAYPLHGYFQPSERIVQLARLLDAQREWSAEEFKRVQTNQDEVFAAEQLSLLLPRVRTPQGAIEKSAFSILQRWNGRSDKSSTGAAIYNEWRSQILRLALLDELGEERFKAFCSIADAWHFYKRLIGNPSSPWWDNVSTGELAESADDIVSRAFTQALLILKNRFGGDIRQWTWGRLHTIEYGHPLGRLKPLNLIFNAGPYAAGGNYSQVDAMAPERGEEAFEVLSGPSTRRIIDFADINRSWGINPLGNSGNLTSRHERDQAELFLRGEYRPQLMATADIEKSAEATLVLSPR